MKWFLRTLERRTRRQQLLREYREEAERLAAYAPSEIAERLGRTKLASRLPTGDTQKLASDIADLPDDDRYLLALVAEGRTRRYISRHLCKAEKTVKQDLDRIVEHLSGRDLGTASDGVSSRDS